MPPTRQSLVPQPMSSSGTVRCSRAPPKSHEVLCRGRGYATCHLPMSCHGTNLHRLVSANLRAAPMLTLIVHLH